jgi:CO dehydrogenase maturation factor
MDRPDNHIIAVCGKGGAGKTALCALLAREVLDLGVRPVLLIDADPAGGLVHAIGERAGATLASVRDRLISEAREAGEDEKARLSRQVDYYVMEALAERQGYAMLAIGRSRAKGCFCPANKILREAIDVVAGQFKAVLIDAEAGLEQINRQVTQNVGRLVVVTDGSQRALETMRQIGDMAPPGGAWVVANRVPSLEGIEIPEGMKPLGFIPEDAALRDTDRAGRPLFVLPPDNPARLAVRRIAGKLGLVDADFIAP